MTESKAPLMHYVARDPAGPIKQTRRDVSQAVGRSSVSAVLCSGENLRVPCQPHRTCLSRGVGRGRHFKLTELFLATCQLYAERRGISGTVTRLELVTCPKCRASALYRRDAEAYERADAQGV